MSNGVPLDELDTLKLKFDDRLLSMISMLLFVVENGIEENNSEMLGIDQSPTVHGVGRAVLDI